MERDTRVSHPGQGLGEGDPLVGLIIDRDIRDHRRLGILAMPLPLALGG